MTNATSPPPDQFAQARDLLSLISIEQVVHADAVPGLPGTWSARPDGPGARVDLGPGEQLYVDGVATGGVVEVDAIGAFMRPGRVVSPDGVRGVAVYWFPDAAGGTVWIGVTSPSAPLLASFRGVSSYPHDDRWRIPVTFHPAGADERHSLVRFRRRGEGTHAMDRLGWYAATIDGHEYRLTVDRIPHHAFVTFRDAGSGPESYGAGRTVRILGDPADLEVLDLNEAEVLPCAFNPLFPCPLPPPGNVIRSVVSAGQRDVHFAQR